jgi:hypothetical protein
MEDYFELKMSGGKIEKKLKKDKYGNVANDEAIMGLKNVSSMGASVKYNYIINLPRPAKKAEGKVVKLSADKKKVTVAVTSEDFFETPSNFEYSIEY